MRERAHLWLLIKRYAFARWFFRLADAKTLYRKYDAKYGAALLADISSVVRRELAKPKKPAPPWQVQYPVAPPSNYPEAGDVVCGDGEVWDAGITRLKGYYRNGTYEPVNPQGGEG